MTRSRIGALLLAAVLFSAAGAALAAREPEAPRAALPQPRVAPAPPPFAPEGAQPHVGVIVPEVSVELACAQDGRIERVAVGLGDTVAAGDPLVALESAGIAQEIAVARAQLQRLRAEATIADTELAQARDVATRRAVVASAVESAVSGEELARTRLSERRARGGSNAARARIAEQRARIAELSLQLEQTRVRAPFAARVAARHVDPGAFVPRGTPLLKLVGSSQRVRFGVPVEAAHGFAVDKPIELRVEGLAAPLHLRVDRVAPAVDGAARLVFIEAALPDGHDSLLGRRAFVAQDR